MDCVFPTSPAGGARLAPAAPESESLARGSAFLWSFLCTGKTSIRHGDGVEIVEQGGDAAAIRLIHDRAGAAGGGDDVEAADALLDARDIARRHRQVAQAEAEQQCRKARLAGHFAAHADRHAAAQ